jgi:hypothetical protein
MRFFKKKRPDLLWPLFSLSQWIHLPRIHSASYSAINLSEEILRRLILKVGIKKPPSRGGFYVLSDILSRIFRIRLNRIR